MSTSLLDLPYELREQILTLLLTRSGSIKLQRPVESPTVYTAPISQVCQLLREEAVRIFYHVNTFTWLIDPEATTLMNTAACPQPKESRSEDSKKSIAPRSTMLPRHRTSVLKGLRHLRLDLYLPDPYDRKLWQVDLATQLSDFVALTDNGNKLKDFRVLILTWHCFRNLADWQVDVLCILGQMSVPGHVEIRSRSLDGKVKAALQKIDLTKKIRDHPTSHTVSSSNECCTVGCHDIDWEWEGGVVI